ncbi:hypothetical protein N7489_003650 [Penicillium chrysogenum]|uniref:uncharacterized protein n=1 Tax=Penicillium chrysogenum TaxID=5076 RepID=UPI0024DF0812|nr:uncharacterized protein N7489_003650 [Penicillium chrysogenum]KAJ5253240.1 hypothetical protein N7489_003650 [Penicillium chrysogenum]
MVVVRCPAVERILTLEGGENVPWPLNVVSGRAHSPRRRCVDPSEATESDHPVFDRQCDSATFMKKLAVFLALGSHMNFLATWQIIGFQTTAYDASTNFGISGPPTVAETQLSGLSAGHKIWNTLLSVRQPIYISN